MSSTNDPLGGLKSEFDRLSDDARTPDLADLRRRSSERSARRNSTIMGTGAALVAVAAVGVTLGGGLGMGSGQNEGSTMAGQASSAENAQAQASTDSTDTSDTTDATGKTGTEATMPDYGLDESRPGMTTGPEPSILERLRRAEDRANVPFPQAMQQNRPLAHVGAVDRFTQLADTIVVSPRVDMRVTTSSASAPAELTMTTVRETLKSPESDRPVASASMELTGSQQPVGSPTGLYLVFAKDGATLAVYSINGNYASQVSPVKTSAPGMIRVDTLRAALALRHGRALPSSSVGTKMPLSLYTHCGIAGFHLGGRWYAREGGELSDGNGNPPAGWGDPTQEGMIALNADASVATFTDEAGHTETFRVGDPNSPEATRTCL
ncbi:MAG: hypothetical protein Q4G51_13680 [Dermatophilus congolensis]|nr:hypothetical protein [Dermatophilus congolensis]